VAGNVDLYTLLESTLKGLGYELVDLELSNRGTHLRVFIDKPEGVTIDDCVLVSNHLTRVLAVEMDYDYDRLEVSSPGLDRPLKKEADFIRFKGEKAQLKLRIPLGGRRNFSGTLGEVNEGVLQLDVEGVMHSIELSNVEKARLIPNV
jgi:ribosome maturation factor RimP